MAEPARSSPLRQLASTNSRIALDRLPVRSPSIRDNSAFNDNFRRDAISHSGDWFGPPVNLASRVTGVARASSVLATAEVRDELDERFEWSFAGTRRLKGISRPVALHRARPRVAGA